MLSVTIQLPGLSLLDSVLQDSSASTGRKDNLLSNKCRSLASFTYGERFIKRIQEQFSQKTQAMKL